MAAAVGAWVAFQPLFIMLIQRHYLECCKIHILISFLVFIKTKSESRIKEQGCAQAHEASLRGKWQHIRKAFWMIRELGCQEFR